ncbi:serine-threonine protein kinase [Streptomyces sp. NPDC005805]|uniref:serine-threonine protein kinase n=1 Tax=Streptomyces sp. NPDC005805 TaxID=3157068 RepID=UPI0034057444
MAGAGVQPYREVVFDADGDLLEPYEGRPGGGPGEEGVTDLVLFAHGWNNTPSTARRLNAAFFAEFAKSAAQTPQARLGYGGVLWPSMRFGDEPIPDVASPAPGAQPAGPGLDRWTREVLAELHPGHRATVRRLGLLLDQRPESRAAFGEFGRLARQLAAAPPGGLETGFAEDLPSEEQGPPAVLYEDALTLCRRFADALDAEPGASPGPPSFTGDLAPAWRGAKELLRQTTYYAMKRRAGAVGEMGLGPLLGRLARTAPGLRVHLVGHGHGARLMAFALRGLPEGAENVKSLVLLQGALSHYAFACGLPGAPHSGGALAALQERVDGPVVACHSRYDSALGVFYPLAAGLAGDPASAVRADPRWWAMGHDGIPAETGAARITLAEALSGALPRSGCVSVDAAPVVRRGGPPAGAHSDICHEELARVVLAAGRVGR